MFRAMAGADRSLVGRIMIRRYRIPTRRGFFTRLGRCVCQKLETSWVATGILYLIIFAIVYAANHWGSHV